MEKYFEENQKTQLSMYLERGISDKMKKTIEFLICCLGDVSLPLDIIESYKDYFYSSGGRYDVRTEVESVKGLYEFYKKFPSISAKAFEEISFRYIKDLFEEYSLDIVFEKLIKMHGKTDETLELFISYTEKKADELQKKRRKEARKLDRYLPIYHVDGLVDDYIPFLKSLVIRKHISVDRILDSMPSPELVKKDREHLHRLSIVFHCYFGCVPISYLITEDLAKGEDILKYGERPSYSVSFLEKPVETTFTTQEFIDSTKKTKDKELVRKK